LPPNNQVNSSTLKATITPTWTSHRVSWSNPRNDAEPETNTMTVEMST
jgi:hypothetical protein